MSNKNQSQPKLILNFSQTKPSNFMEMKKQAQYKLPLRVYKKKVVNFRSLQKLSPVTQIDRNKKLLSCEKSQSLEVYVYLLYKNSKIAMTFQSGISLKIVAQTLYKKILQFQITALQHSIQNAAQEAQKVLGFQSQDMDLQFDYLLSIAMEASQKKLTSKIQDLVLKKSKFLRPFFSKSNSKNEIFYKICKCLAIGGFSKVYLARSYTDGRFYAIKFIKKQNSNMKKSVEIDEPYVIEQKFQALANQIEISKQLDHPFLIKLYHAFETENFYGLVQEYCPGGQLFYLLKKKRIFTEKQAKFYFLQILYGLSYLHQKKIIYRDLKPQNVLIDWEGNLKIVDFGLSKKIGDNREKSFSYCGSAQYMAPEMILRAGHSYSLDYYSVGALLYELVIGLPPFYTKDEDQLQQAILFESLSFPSQLNLSNEIKDLLVKLLQKEQKYRLGSFAGLKQILFHPWIGKVNSLDILQKKMQCPYPPDLKNHNFDPDQLGEDQQMFTFMVKKQVSFQLSVGAQREQKLSPYQNQSNSFKNLKKMLQSNDSLRKNQCKYRNTFYKLNNFIKINSKLIESVKNQISLRKIHSNESLKILKSEIPLLQKSTSQTKLNSFTVHKNTKFLRKLYIEQNDTVKKIHKLLKGAKNHQSLDKIHQHYQLQQKTPYFPNFLKEKKQNNRKNDIFRQQKNNTCHVKKPQFEERLFNNLKNTYLSNGSLKRKVFECNVQKTLRVNKSHDNIPKNSKLIKIKNRKPQNIQKKSIIKASFEKITKNFNNQKIFENDSSIQLNQKKVYVSKKKFIRGNKLSLLNQGIVKKNQISD